MNKQNILECERNSLDKIKDSLFLPNYFKMIGLVITILGFITKIILSSYVEDNESLRFFSEHIVEIIILLAMLSIALAKEKIEDELVEKVRGQAFMFAFISGVLYTIFQPVITYLVSLLIKPGKIDFERLDDFVILWFMLIVYLGYFHLLRRTS